MMRHRRSVNIMGLVVWGVLSVGLAALADADDGAIGIPFGGNQWMLITTGSVCRGVDQHRDIEIFEGRVGLSYYFRKGMAVSFEFHSTVFQGSREYDFGKEDVDAVGAGILPMLRWHFLHRQQWSVYLDYGLGMIVTYPEFPPHGTRINVTPQFGLGLAFRTHERWNMIGGLRQFHISNGQGIVSRNPSFDGIQGYAGITYTF